MIGVCANASHAPDCCFDRCLEKTRHGLPQYQFETLTIDLGDVTAALHPYADVNVLEALLSQQSNGLLDLEPQRLWLHQVQRRSCEKRP